MFIELTVIAKNQEEQYSKEPYLVNINAIVFLQRNVNDDLAKESEIKSFVLIENNILLGCAEEYDLIRSGISKSK